MITQITEPKWIPSRREWEIIYTVKDNAIGEYKQCMWAETLIAAENIVKHIKERIKNNNKQ